MSDPANPPADPATTPAPADPPEQDGIKARLAQLEAENQAYRAAEEQRAAEQRAADEQALEEASELERAKAKLLSQGESLAKLAKSQRKGLSLPAGVKALLDRMSPAEQIGWLADHGVEYRPQATASRRTPAGGSKTLADMSPEEAALAFNAKVAADGISYQEAARKYRPLYDRMCAGS